MTIAGSDSGSGAGLQADLRAMAAFGVLATTAVTAVTAQNTAEVRAVHLVPPAMVEAQIDAVLADLPVAATKTGMLGAAEVVELVGNRAAHGDLPRLVVDPVLVASTGRPLLEADGVAAYRERLLPHALVVTPNTREAAVLVGADAPPIDVEGMADLARRVHALGPRWVLVKGGHLPGVELAGDGAGAAVAAVPDVLFDGRELTPLRAPWVPTRNIHGTGCSLAAALAANLALGLEVPEAVSVAKAFVHAALVGARHWDLGAGAGPIDQLGWSAGR
ncbi:MAG: bifunctional hydroxymethylpyrimidine kinase/phosphomethylpyrimidine kinase [Acidimicrobiales bacterium]|nr:bifunctional hydroxymethylpyrimidine kinase/phosphomethylpyrimidine kinase [Acidimicrobiales bacterium]